VTTACRISSRGKFGEAFYKLSQDLEIVGLESGIGCFLTLAKLSCASWSSRDHFGWFFFEAPFLCSFLSNEF
jgi:hypothetical protein